MKLKQLLEGTYDRSRNKAVFLCGLPASGKTEFYEKYLKNEDLKQLDSDKIMVFLAKKDKKSLGDTENYNRYKKEISRKLKSLNAMYTKRNLGVLIDTTGSNLKQTLTIKKKLEEKGYSCSMVYIKSTLENSLKKAKTRERAVDDSYIRLAFKKLEKNIEVYKKEFNLFLYSDDVGIERKLKSWIGNKR